MSDHSTNPFFCNLDGGDLSQIDKKDVYKECRYVVIICPKDNSTTPEYMYEKYLPSTVEESFADTNMVLIKSNNSMLKNYYHRHSATIVSKMILQYFNSSSLNLDEEEIVVPLFELCETDARLYISLYCNGYTVEEVMKAQTMYRYFNCKTYSYPVQTKITEMISSVGGRSYWENEHSCKISATGEFMSRTFANKRNSLKLDIDYLADILEKDTVVPNIHKTYYKISNAKLPVSKDNITEFFKIISNKDRYNLFNNLLLNKNMCHLVVNNADVLDIMAPTIKKYLPLYKYLWGYAWLTMYMEESIVKTRTSVDRRYVFSLGKSASKLPIFPYCTEDIYMNPYMVLPVSSKCLSNIYHGVVMDSTHTGYGLDTLDGFKRKFRLFSGNDETFDIFEGLETFPDSQRWKHFAISGSSIPLCVEKESPLVSVVATEDSNYTERWLKFFEEYASTSDIDIMCNKLNTSSFIEETDKLISVVDNNLVKRFGKSDVEIDSVKTIMVRISKEHITKIPELSDINVDNIDTDEFREYFYSRYITEKTKQNRQLRKLHKDNRLYNIYFKLSQCNDMTLSVKDEIYESNDDYIMIVRLNDIVSDNLGDNPIIMTISESFRIKVSSPYLRRNLEIFKIKYGEFFSTVSRFHLPCVRGYYDGDDVHLLPSCITAIMTHINMDYKYFASVRDPVEILNKYRMRGFGVILNEKESRYMSAYNRQQTDNSSLYDKNTTPVLSSDIFRPSMFYTKTKSSVDYNHPTPEYVFTNDDLQDTYRRLCKYKKTEIDFLKYKTFDNKGVAPVKKWLIDAAYDTM